MPLARVLRVLLFASTAFLAAPTVTKAQVPTATGRSFTLTNLGTGYKLFIPSTYVHRPQDATDLVVHFHGDPQTYWNNAKYADLNAAVVTVNLGALSGSYQMPYQNDTTLFGDVITEARTVLRNQSDFADNLLIDKLAVTSFSAGYGAVREILKQSSYFNDIDAMVLADTVYASFTGGSDHTPLDSQMSGFRNFAVAAKNGNKTLTLSHSKVLTFTYCNTIETADDIMAFAGVTPSAYGGTGLDSMQFYRRAGSGNLKVFGVNGADGDAHLRHLRGIGQFLDDLPVSQLPEPAGAAVWLAFSSLLSLRRRR